MHGGEPLTMNFRALIVCLFMCPLVGEDEHGKPFSYSFHKSLIHVPSPEYIIYMLVSHLL
jgi:hypothetical protein